MSTPRSLPGAQLPTRCSTCHPRRSGSFWIVAPTASTNDPKRSRRPHTWRRRSLSHPGSPTPSYPVPAISFDKRPPPHASEAGPSPRSTRRPISARCSVRWGGRWLSSARTTSRWPSTGSPGVILQRPLRPETRSSPRRTRVIRAPASSWRRKLLPRFRRSGFQPLPSRRSTVPTTRMALTSFLILSSARPAIRARVGRR